MADMASSATTASTVHQHQSKLRDYTKEYRQIRVCGLIIVYLDVTNYSLIPFC